MSLSDRVQDILKARERIKSRIRSNEIHDQALKEETVKASAPIVKELESMKDEFMVPFADELETMKNRMMDQAPVYRAIEDRPIAKIKKRKSFHLNIDKDIDPAFLNVFDLKLPSLYFNMDESQRNSIITAELSRVNQILQSLGGKLKGKLTPNEKANIKNLIERLRHYKEALKSIQQIPRFVVPTDTSQTGTVQATTSQTGTVQAGTSQASTSQTGTVQTDMTQAGTGLMDGSMQQDVCERLQLLIASREAGNDSPEILMEARHLLQRLLERKMISATEGKLIHHHFLR